MKKCFYIAEIFLPNNSAYSTHVLKMCDHLTKNFDITELLIINSFKKTSYYDLKKKYLFSLNKKFFVRNITGYKKINFLNRIIYGFNAARYIKKSEPNLVITRSLLASFFLTIFKVNHFLEIHHELFGLTKFIFINLKYINSKYIKKVIFISNELSKLFKIKKKIILHDAADLKNFKYNKKIKKIKKIGYIGSFYDGRGIDIIKKLSEMNPDLIFYMVGKRNNDNFNYKKISNLKIINFVPYSKVPYLLSKFDVLLMPYKKNVAINSKNLNTANYCSPLKMFDYLASGKLILSSKLKGINEVLINNTNSIIVKNDNILSWHNALSKLRNNKSLINKLSKNAILTSKKYTWKNRVKKIIEYNR